MKMKIETTGLLILLSFVLLCLLGYLYYIYGVKSFNNFYSYQKIGIIEHIESSAKNWTDFKISTDRKHIHMYLEVYGNSKNTMYFHDIAQVGDSLYKPAYSDTIYLYRKDSLIKVCFNKKKR